jgi:hypothetical protein
VKNDSIFSTKLISEISKVVKISECRTAVKKPRHCF